MPALPSTYGDRTDVQLRTEQENVRLLVDNSIRLLEEGVLSRAFEEEGPDSPVAVSGRKPAWHRWLKDRSAWHVFLPTDPRRTLRLAAQLLGRHRATLARGPHGAGSGRV